MALLDRVKFDGIGDWLVYKHDSEQLKLGSQLIVNQSQEVLFFKGGKALDLFGPGTHTLKTGNIPLLNKLVNLPFGGDTPFSAEVYYINKTEGLHHKWGTQTPIQIQDPKYGLLITVRSYGSFGITITDARHFVTSLVGAVRGNTVISHNIVKEFLNTLINAKIKEIISRYIIEKNISIFEISMYLNELSAVCYEQIKTSFEGCGLEITNFMVASIDTPKEDTEKLKQALERSAELKILGEHYYRQRSFDVLDNLAENEGSGGLAAAGMGLGMGIGAGGAAGQAFGTLMQEMNVQPTQTQQQKVQQSFSASQQAAAPLNQSPSAGCNCHKCNAANSPEAKFCATCGERLVEPTINCHSCNAELSANAKFCSTCGANQQHKNCTNCGKQNEALSKFCFECGTSF